MDIIHWCSGLKVVIIEDDIQKENGMSNEKIHTTNYFDTFIEVAEDTKAVCGIEPKPRGGKKTIPGFQFELLSKNPYRYTSDDVFFQVFALRNKLTKADFKRARELFFSKGQPCFRASPLTKTFGFGVHSDTNGKVAIYGMESNKYRQFIADPNIKKIKAMRNSKRPK